MDQRDMNGIDLLSRYMILSHTYRIDRIRSHSPYGPSSLAFLQVMSLSVRCVGSLLLL